MYVCTYCYPDKRERFETEEQYEEHIISVAGSSYSCEPPDMVGKILERSSLHIKTMVFLRDTKYRGLQQSLPPETILTVHYNFRLLQEIRSGVWAQSLGVITGPKQLKMLNDFTKTYTW